MSESNIFGECPCGKPVRYETSKGGSCNKYIRCLTYEELDAKVRTLEQKNNELVYFREKIINFADNLKVDDKFPQKNESTYNQNK